MNSSGSGRRPEGFLTGKGFYIVLFLCAAVIGVSAWMLAAGNRTMVREAEIAGMGPEERRVETIIIPPPREESIPVISDEELIIEEAPEVKNEGLSEPEAALEVWSGAEEAEAMDEFIWPVEGQLERVHDGETLRYDPTMQDWRCHEGIDILSPLGTGVKAAHSGTVTEVRDDDLYGRTVLIDHGDGTVSVYSNLDENTAVAAGDYVEAGSVIGSVGTSALCESGQCSHLHYALRVNGESRDPLEFLPA